jgi:hypothetical protein
MCGLYGEESLWDLGLGTWDLGLRLVIEQKKREVSIKTIFVTPKLIN